MIDAAYPSRPASTRDAQHLSRVARSTTWCYIFPPGWSQLSFQRVPEIKTIKNRLHIDVAVHDLASATKQAARIGARKIGEVQYTASGSFQVMDPSVRDALERAGSHSRGQ